MTNNETLSEVIRKEFEAIYKQAVKDTAKDICGIAVAYYNGEYIYADWFFESLKERYGVEVE